jgi:hypothetical protein
MRRLTVQISVGEERHALLEDQLAAERVKAAVLEADVAAGLTSIANLEADISSKSDYITTLEGIRHDKVESPSFAPVPFLIPFCALPCCAS